MVWLFLFGIAGVGLYCYGLCNGFPIILLLLFMMCGMISFIFGFSSWNQLRANSKRRRYIAQNWVCLMARVTEIRRVKGGCVVCCDYDDNGHHAHFESAVQPYRRTMKTCHPGRLISVYVRHYSFDRFTDDYFVDAGW